MNKNGIYVAYFWSYASKEQIEDMVSLSIDVIVDYILYIWKEIYETKEKESIYAKIPKIENLVENKTN